MKVALTVSPSFDSGFGVEISERRKPSRGSYFVIKTKGLGADSFVRAQQHAETFARIANGREFDAAAFEELSRKVLAVEVSPPDKESICLDGTLFALSIERGSSSISVEWNSALDSKWKGVGELVEFLGVLYERYHYQG
jgi:hypothetical protein